MLSHTVIVSSPTGFKPWVIHTINDVVIVTTNQTFLCRSPRKPLDPMPNMKVNFLTIGINPYNSSPQPLSVHEASCHTVQFTIVFICMHLQILIYIILFLTHVFHKWIIVHIVLKRYFMRVANMHVHRIKYSFYEVIWNNMYLCKFTHRGRKAPNRLPESHHPRNLRKNH
jgi:hypothetical protein